MRFLFTIGRLTLFDFSLFRIEEHDPSDSADVVVVHKYEDEEDGPPDLFGGK